jgi:hypothetical protein
VKRVAAALVATAALLPLAAPAAEAGSFGTAKTSVLSRRYPVGPEAELVIYWDGYQNSARVNHLGAAYGSARYTRVDICRSNPQGTCTGPTQTNAGNFRYYAGPVYSGPSAHTCVNAYGEMDGFKVKALGVACG